MLVTMWKNCNPCTLLEGMKKDSVAVENYLQFFKSQTEFPQTQEFHSLVN